MASSIWTNDSKRAFEVEQKQQLDVSGLHLPARDPHSAGAAAQTGLHAHARLLRGRVLDAVAYTGCYKVAFESGCPTLPCVLAALTSLLPVGTRQINSLVVGSTVWAIVHPQLAHGVIVAVEPSPGLDPTLALSDALHWASRCGLRVDSAHHAILRLRGNGGVVDWSAGRPFDGTNAGEWGAIAETGLKIALDSYMAQLAVDEATGVFAFYPDQLLRVAGYNLQVQSAGHEEERLDDQGEILHYRGETPYPWEHLGALRPGVDPLRELSAKACQVDEPHYGPVEPVHDDQQPFHRIVALGGYVGQGGKRLVLLPPPEGEIYRYGDGSPPPAVFEEQLALSGRWGVRSAKGITLAKRPAIPGVRRVRRPEAAAGDNDENYKAAGLRGGGDDHEIAGQVRTTDGARPHLQQAAAVADVHAHAFNWEGEHALHYHEEDWEVAEEADTEIGTNQATLTFSALAGSFCLDRPAPVSLEVDHRYGAVDYFPAESYLSLLDDGGVVLGDGYASEIVMTAGHNFITCPGDVWIKAGRNINFWAGNDIILRAKNAIDLSATRQSVRIKAHRDVQVLAGADGAAGAVLLESRAPAAYRYEDKVGEEVVAGGIQLKAAGEVAALASAIYLRTGGGKIAPGPITLDAGRGTQAIVTYSDSFQRHLRQAADYFGSEGRIDGAAFWDKGTLVYSGGAVLGRFVEILDGGLLVNGWINVAGGHVATELAAERYKGLVPSPDEEGLKQIADSFAQGNEAVADLIAAGGKSWKAAFEEYWYGEERPGADATIDAVGFSFRTPEQYRTGDFVLYEDRWQRMARAGGGAPATWTEEGVAAGSTTTYPYPGRAKWADESCLREQDLALYDLAAGVARARDPGLYGDPEFEEPAEKVLDGNYGVIR